MLQQRGARIARASCKPFSHPNADQTVADNQGYDRTPLWGWVLYVAALAMFIGLIIKSLGTGS